MKRTLEHDRSEGFSAVEVLIAAAIIAVALLAIATMFPTGYSNVAQSGKRTAAVNLAQQKLEEVRNTPPATLVNGVTSETNIAGYAGYSRTRTIADFAGPPTGVKQVTVTVTTPTGATVTVMSLVAQ
ncbi:MAG: prepilin-type N-terminal cleavage/methylation domain-containing protein [Candidatus Methylomirabilales bacterium]